MLVGPSLGLVLLICYYLALSVPTQRRTTSTRRRTNALPGRRLDAARMAWRPPRASAASPDRRCRMIRSDAGPAAGALKAHFRRCAPSPFHQQCHARLEGTVDPD